MLWRTKPTEVTSSPERRSSARLDKVFAVWLEGERGEVHGIARNISPGGLFVETPETQPIGSEVRVNFTSFSGGGLVAVGEVRYVCHLVGRRAPGSEGPDVPVGVQGMGIRFLRFESASAPFESLH
jgi:PilZ domain